MQKKGPKAYSTAGWLGLTDEEIAKTIREMQNQGFDCFKMKVGQNLNHDKVNFEEFFGIIFRYNFMCIITLCSVSFNKSK